MTTFEAPRTPDYVAPAPTSTGKLPPEVDFKLSTECDRLKATPPGARIVCRLADDGSSQIRIRRADNDEHIAHVAIVNPGPYSITDETIAIASALYWSWWRSEDLRGVTWGEHLAAEEAAS